MLFESRQFHKRLVLSVLIATSMVSVTTLRPTTAQAMFGRPKALSKSEAILMAATALQGVLKELRTQIPPPEGSKIRVPISQFTSPADVVKQVMEAESIVSKGDAAELQKSTIIREIYVTAIALLYQGRPETQKGALDGWYPARERGRATGLPELENLIKRGRLDEVGKNALTSFVENHDFTNADVLINSGFAPTKQILTPEIQEEVLHLIHESRTAEPYKPLHEITGNQPTVEQLLDASEASPADKIFFKTKFFPALNKNFYDKSVGVFNDQSKKFIDYFGRDEEVDLVLDVVSRIEKGHVLMTGKAGVGKTTLAAMLSDGFIQGKYSIRGEPPPIILELSILDVTNQQDPSAIIDRLKAAQRLAEFVKRRVILYIDEAHISTPIVRNALKSPLTDKLLQGESQVHLIMSTTSAEARDFLSDSAFSRRFAEVNIPEFNKDQTIALIKKTYLPLWKKEHRHDQVQLEGIDDEAFSYAYKYGHYEQPHAGNPTQTKELLEGSIARQVRLRKAANQNGPFILSVEDIRQYLKAALREELLPGDPDFDEKFEKKWAAFSEEYVGNDALKLELKPWLRNFFAQPDKSKMTTGVFFGPPGAGKSYLEEMLAKHFFSGKNSVLTLNGGELKNGGLELNKLIGSPPGTVGSEEQRSKLTRFMGDEKKGIIKLEEADYVHQDVMQFFTNVITDMEFADGLNKTWKTARYILAMNSNIGQDLMIPVNQANKMNWTQYETRRSQMTDHIVVNGKTVERIKPSKLDQVFDTFMRTIVEKSHPGEDTSGVAQEANKQRRRFTAFYVLPPNHDELMAAARAKIRAYVARASHEYQVTIHIPDEIIEPLIALDAYQFEKGFSYVEEKLTANLFDYLDAELHRKGEKVDVRLEHFQDEHAGQIVDRQALILDTSNGTQRHELPVALKGEKNPWAENEGMRTNIRGFVTNVRKYIRGNIPQIQKTQSLLKEKLSNWNRQIVITQLGTTGNGKTEFFKALAKTLWPDDEKALHIISGLNNKYQLANHFRPPKGIQGGMEETETEAWIKSRINSGGGVILFDELLSISGLGKEQHSNRMEVINELYDLLDTGHMMIGNKRYDMRGFIIGITGNALQELFQGIPDDPASEQRVRRILEMMTSEKIAGTLTDDYHIDAPKVARLGSIFLNGPLPADETALVGEMQMQKIITSAQSLRARKLEVKVDPKIRNAVVQRLKTIKLGMRKVNEGFQTIIGGPLSGILDDVPGAQTITAELSKDEKIRWTVNGKPVVLEGIKVDDSGLENRNWVYASEMAKDAHDRTPQLKEVEEPPKLIFSEQALNDVVTHEFDGHWVVGVMIKGKNSDEAISLYPGEGYLGYVQPKDEKIYQHTSLSTLMEDVVRLEAGHRAVILLNKMYSTGGGTVDTDEKKRNDDLGRIKNLFKAILNNQLLANHSELSSNGEKEQLFKLLKAISLGMTDHLIMKGHDSKLFEPLKTELKEKRYLEAARLDAFVESLDLKKLGTPQANFAEAYVIAAQQIAGAANLNKAMQSSLKDLNKHMFIELRQRASGHKELEKQIDKIFVPLNIDRDFHGAPSCSALLKG